jgi:hypothetical protein
MKEKLRQMMEEAKETMGKIASLSEAEELRIKFLGKKGELTGILRSMGSLAPEERKTLGQVANAARTQLEEMINEVTETIQNSDFEKMVAIDTIKDDSDGSIDQFRSDVLLCGKPKTLIFLAQGKGYGEDIDITMDHTNPSDCESMIAYIQDHDVEYWEDRINTWINDMIAKDTDIEWNVKDRLSSNDRFSDYISIHDRVSKDPITLYHYWIALN